MEAMNFFDYALSNISWIWFAFAVIAAFAVGALWYSLLFFNLWVKVFKVDLPKGDSEARSWVRSFAVQFITGSLLGFMFFMLSSLSIWLSVVALFAVPGWQMCALTFKYANTKQFMQATMIESGYTLVAGCIYLLFSSL